MNVHVVPILLGGGARLFDHADGRQTEYQCVHVVSSPAASHYRFRR